jgi:hypothetical protein
MVQSTQTLKAQFFVYIRKGYGKTMEEEEEEEEEKDS